MNDVTRLLEAMRHGDDPAGGALLNQVYAELRQLARAKMACEQPGHTLQPTALVHEAWMRLGEQEVGDFLRRIMAQGATADWRKVLRDATGEALSTRAMVEYYAPLLSWLEKENAGRPISFAAPTAE
jgi:hypothetical protein